MAFTDSFTGSDGTALATHDANWTVHQGTGEIQSNSLKLYNNSAIAWATYAGTVNDDQYSQAVASAISSGHFNGLVVRCNTSGTATFYGTSWDGSNAYIFKQVAGAYTQLGAAVTSPSAGDTVKLAVSGTTISLYHNGSLVTTRTDSDITSGNPGVFAYHESASRLDTWQGGNFARAQISWAELEVRDPSSTSSDPFTNSNGTGLAAHNSYWTVHGGTFTIQSNELEASNSGSDSWATYAGTFSDDQYAQCVASSTIVDGTFIGLIVRGNTSGTKTYYAFNWDSDSAFFYKYVAGVYTSLATPSSYPVAGDTVKLQIVGTTLTAYINGVSVASVTDASIASGNPGVTGYNTAGTRLDTWSAASVRRAMVSWAELEVPNPTARAQISWAELEVPLAPARAMVSWAELEVPDIGGVTERRRLVGVRWHRNQ